MVGMSPLANSDASELYILQGVHLQRGEKPTLAEALPEAKPRSLILPVVSLLPHERPRFLAFAPVTKRRMRPN